jgi:REP element-mobilizing transposase RayT
MGDTYVQAYFHLVFAVKNRQALIKRLWKDDLEKYITGIVQNHGHKLIAVGTMPDHIHIFIGYNLNQTIPELVEKIKTSSNHWIKENRLTNYKFNWQKGYGAFTHSHSQINAVAKYVLNQKSHHRKKTFREEYLEMLNKYKVVYKNEYLFDFFKDITGWE